MIPADAAALRRERRLTLSIAMPVVYLDIGAVGDGYDFLIKPSAGHAVET
jgi:hypothetical protein